MFASASKTASATAANYIEDVFSTYLYTGAGSASQTISNGIDLAGKGGMVWSQSRAGGVYDYVADTLRGVNKNLQTQTTDAEGSSSSYINAFNSNGFGVGVNAGSSGVNFASWTFRKQPKFFDVVTYTGTGSQRTVSHNLGSVPGCIIVKSTTYALGWPVYHRSIGAGGEVYLNDTQAVGYGDKFPVTPTSTQFTVSANDYVNKSGETYVAYLFAHDAGGFGLTGSDNVITCGSFTTTSNSATVNLGWEPQWLLIKGATTVPGWGAGDWAIFDNMRGISTVIDGSTPSARLMANTTGAEVASTDYQAAYANPTSTGFQFKWSVAGTGTQFIYIAIRRGPMKTPTSGTSVLSNLARTGSGTNPVITGLTSPVDMVISQDRGGSSLNFAFDRLRGNSNWLTPSGTNAEGGSATLRLKFDVQDGYSLGSSSVNPNQSGRNYIFWNFKRAPSFMDVVCYTGDGTNNRAITHNLGVAPELAIIKARNTADDWVVRSSAFPTSGSSGIAYLNLTLATTNAGNSYSPTSTTFTVHNNNNQNGSTFTYVAYLFASIAGVSKVGSYTGNGSSQTINCGFTGGVRFLMIKNTSTGGTDWQVWDTARGITAGNDPVLYLNSTAAEVNANFISQASTGFTLNDGDSQYNANGSTYIFLAIA